jgi:hypothetical protein
VQIFRNHEASLTADLHYRIDWFRWLIEQAPNYGLVCIADDLLDMFNVESTIKQAREVSRLIKDLADAGRSLFRKSRQMLAACSRTIGHQCTHGSLISARTGSIPRYSSRFMAGTPSTSPNFLKDP